MYCRSEYIKLEVMVGIYRYHIHSYIYMVCMVLPPIPSTLETVVHDNIPHIFKDLLSFFIFFGKKGQRSKAICTPKLACITSDTSTMDCESIFTSWCDFLTQIGLNNALCPEADVFKSSSPKIGTIQRRLVWSHRV